MIEVMSQAEFDGLNYAERYIYMAAPVTVTMSRREWTELLRGIFEGGNIASETIGKIACAIKPW